MLKRIFPLKKWWINGKVCTKSALQPKEYVMKSLLYVANKKLPDNDYRVMYGKKHSKYHILYALPEPPEGVPAERFVPMNFREGFVAGDLRAFFQLWSYLRQQYKAIDLVHFYSTKLVLLGPIIAWLAGVPSMVTVTGLGRVYSQDGVVYRLLRFLYRGLMAMSIALSRAVLFQNHGDLALFQRMFPFFHHKMVYVGSAVGGPILERMDYEASPLRVLLVSRIMPQKGIEDFLEVAKRLQGQEFEFILVGPFSPRYNDLADLVRRYHYEGTIKYKGEVYGSKDLLAEYGAAHVFLFPSRYGEGLARVMLEAGFAGLCPIAYDINANLDLIAEGRGFLLRSGDIERIVEVLLQLRDRRDLLEQNARAYQAYVTSTFSLDAYRVRMDKILERFLGD
ncbi:glycosyltransferase [Moorellaceae bacterium AZ2]